MEKKCLYHWKEVPICVCMDVCTGSLNCIWADEDLNCHNLAHCKHKDYGISKVWYGNTQKLSEVYDMKQNTKNTKNTKEPIDNSRMYCGYNALHNGEYDCNYIDVNYACTSKECEYRVTAKQLQDYLEQRYELWVERLIQEDLHKKNLELERLINRFSK